MDTFIKKLKKEKSIIKDVYRDSAKVVLKSSPIDIIKKSKGHARELHLAFSAVLWVGAAIMYMILNFIFGYEYSLSASFSEITWTWLIFILAALIEALAETYFSNKNLKY